MLSFDAYEAANAWGKAQCPDRGGLSKQAWMITPKIREVDAAIAPADQAQIFEAHPEVAFWRLNEKSACLNPKRSEDGYLERMRILKRSGVRGLRDAVDQALKRYPRKDVARDDLIDACAIAVTARDRLKDNAIRFSDGAKDDRGLVLEIWG